MSKHQDNQTILCEISDLMKREQYSVNTKRTYSVLVKRLFSLFY